MHTDYIAKIVMPTLAECEQIAQQVISEAKSVFSSGALLSGAPLAEEIVARIKQQIEVSITVVPLHDDRQAVWMPVLLTEAEFFARRDAERLARRTREGHHP